MGVGCHLGGGGRAAGQLRLAVLLPELRLPRLRTTHSAPRLARLVGKGMIVAYLLSLPLLIVRQLLVLRPDPPVVTPATKPVALVRLKTAEPAQGRRVSVAYASSPCSLSPAMSARSDVRDCSLPLANRSSAAALTFATSRDGCDANAAWPTHGFRQRSQPDGSAARSGGAPSWTMC